MFRIWTLTAVVVLLCLPVYAQVQTVADFEQALRLAAPTVWKVLEMTKQITPTPSADVLLEAPKGIRERATLHGEEATKLVIGDVITCKHNARFITAHGGPVAYGQKTAVRYQCSPYAFFKSLHFRGFS